MGHGSEKIEFFVEHCQPASFAADHPYLDYHAFVQLLKKTREINVSKRRRKKFEGGNKGSPCSVHNGPMVRKK